MHMTKLARNGTLRTRPLQTLLVAAVIVLALSLSICVDVSAGSGAADAVSTVALKVDRLDAAAADRIIPKDAKLERLPLALRGWKGRCG